MSELAPLRSPVHGPPSVDSNPAERMLCAWLFLLPVGAAVLLPRLPLSLAVGDFLVAPLIASGLLAMSHRGGPATRALRTAAPWMYLVLVGSILGLVGVGIAGWAVVDLVKNATAALSFFAVWHLLSTPARIRSMFRGFVLGATVTAVLLITDGGPRPSAAFYHPNYAAHYLACAALLVVGSPGIRRRHRVGLGLLFLAGILATASFGALAMVLVGGGFMIVGASGDRRSRSWRTAPPWMRFAALGVLAATAALVIPLLLAQRVGSDALNPARLDRSATTRAELYRDALALVGNHPTGVGPTGVKNRSLLIREGVPWESHSDPLGYLLERGVIGLVGLIGFALVVHRSARRFSMSRALFFMLVASAVLRETLNYRHLWLALALALATDLQRSTVGRAPVGAARP